MEYVWDFCQCVKNAIVYPYRAVCTDEIKWEQRARAILDTYPSEIKDKIGSLRVKTSANTSIAAIRMSGADNLYNAEILAKDTKSLTGQTLDFVLAHEIGHAYQRIICNQLVSFSQGIAGTGGMLYRASLIFGYIPIAYMQYASYKTLAVAIGNCEKAAIAATVNALNHSRNITIAIALLHQIPKIIELHADAMAYETMRKLDAAYVPHYPLNDGPLPATIMERVNWFMTSSHPSDENRRRFATFYGHYWKTYDWMKSATNDYTPIV